MRDSTNVAIIGGGPIGIELAIALQQANIPYTLFEAKQIGDAFMQWPPNTQFFSTPEHVALAGIPVHTVNQQGLTGEQYLAYLRTLVEMFDLNVHVYEPVTRIEQQADGFRLHTQTRQGQKAYDFRYVVVAIGGMAKPRYLNIPGEGLPHVSHYFPGPHPYFRTRVLVVGGRNSAIESALRCWRAGAKVTLSYRRSDFEYERIKPHLSMDLRDRLKKGEIDFYPRTVPLEITPTHVVLDDWSPNGQTVEHETDFVLLNTGFEADLSLLEKSGVSLEGESKVPTHNPETMETNVPGLFVAGTAAGGTQQRFKLFISTCHHHVGKIMQAITGEANTVLGTVPARNNAVTWREVQAN